MHGALKRVPLSGDSGALTGSEAGLRGVLENKKKRQAERRRSAA
jgi:hypothetical protein